MKVFLCLLRRVLLGALLALTGCGSRSDEDVIRERVHEFYSAASEGSEHQMWEMYTASFRNDCSFERMVEFQEAERKQFASAQLKVLDPIQVKIQDQTATAIYRVELRDAQEKINGFYDRSISLVREDDGFWHFQEQCY